MLNLRWSLGMLHLVQHGRWRQYLPKQRGQNIIGADQYQIIQRRSIGDDNHPLTRL